MTRYPKSAKYVPIHDCYSERFTFNLKTDRYECPVCGEPYHPPAHCEYVFPPEEKLKFFNPFWTPAPNLNGKLDGHGMTLEPGDRVHLVDVKADVLVFWKPYLDYSKK